MKYRRKRQPQSDEAKARISAANARTWADPAKRQQHSQRLALSWSDPERREHQSILTAERMAAPSVRAKISERTAEAMARPDVKERQRQGLARAWPPEKRAAQAALTRERMAAWRARRMDEAKKVFRQMPAAERETALAGLASAAAKGKAAP